ncbi:MAG: hypothetical protein ACJ74H_16625 [Thermoanaerobaculia bacterium]
MTSLTGTRISLAAQLEISMKALIVAIAILLPAPLLQAQDFTEPIKYTWIATSCENWDCAVSAFLLAGGNPHTIILPTHSEKRPWLVLRRVEEGSVYVPEDEPFSCEVFQQMENAMTRYNELNTCQSPMVMNTLDGRAVVMSMAKCEPSARRRAAGH